MRNPWNWLPVWYGLHLILITLVIRSRTLGFSLVRQISQLSTCCFSCNFTEALNGRLPNQDLINSLERIARYTAGVPVTIYDHLDPNEESSAIAPFWLTQTIYDMPGVKTYFHRAKNVARHVRYQYHGRGSGVHGLFRKWISILFFVGQIDSIPSGSE